MTKFEELMENEEFVKGLDEMKSVDDVATAFKFQGVDIEKEMPEMAQSEELFEKDLNQVPGGVVLTVTGILAACTTIGGTKWLSTLYNGSCFSAYMILRKSNSDYKKGNMYRTYSKEQVDKAMKTLEDAMYNAGFGWKLK